MQTYSLPQNAEGLYKKAKRTRDCSVGVYSKNKDHDVFLSGFASMLTYMAHAFKMKEVLEGFEFGVDVAYELVTKQVTPESINAAMKLIMDNDTDYIQLAEFAYRQAKAEGIIKE